MTPYQVFFIVFCVLGISSGQILFKLAALSLPKSKSLWHITTFLVNPFLISGLVLFLGMTVLWILILRTIPLNNAYPFMALAFIFVPMLGAIFLGETIELKMVLGSLLIIAGIVVTVR